MAGSARLSSIADLASSSSQSRKGFPYEDMAALNSFSADESLSVMDHRPLHPLPMPPRQHPQQILHGDLAMKRRISEEMERHHESEKILVLERGRADRLLGERGARIAGGGRATSLLLQTPAERSALMFPEQRVEGTGSFAYTSYSVPDRRSESEFQLRPPFREEDRVFDKAESWKRIHAYGRRNDMDAGMTLGAESVTDRGFFSVDALKSHNEPNLFDHLRPSTAEKHVFKDFARITGNLRGHENARDLDAPRAAENFRDSISSMDRLRTGDLGAMDLLEANARSMEQHHDLYQGLESLAATRDRLQSSNSSRVADKSRGSENNKHINSPLSTGTANRLNRQLDKVVSSEERVDFHEASSRPICKSPLRVKDQEKRRSAHREQEDEKSRDAVEKQRHRSTDDASVQEIVARYKVALAELTFNSKPVITNLTIVAGDNLYASKIVTDIVCAHILEVPVEQKLPSLYLLDSIVKNISNSYVKHFAARLPEVFIKSYKQVDPSQYPAMQHLFKTWRGVFDSEPLQEIERVLHFNILGSNPPSAAPPPNAARVTEPPSVQQRSGHGIHVNPKYLEAQRQKLQQSKQVERGSSTPEEATSMHKLSGSLPEFDYATLCEKSGVDGERKGTWDTELPKREVDDMDSTSFRQRIRNDYDMYHSPRALIDAYGNVRGMRSSRLPPSQSTVELDRRDRCAPREWQSAEEEEYSWADGHSKLMDADEKVQSDKDWWIHDNPSKTLMPGSFSAREQASSHVSWATRGIFSNVVDRPAFLEGVGGSGREFEDLPSLRHLRALNPKEESNLLGLKGHYVNEQQLQHPVVGRLPRSVTKPPSPREERPLPLQVERTVLSSFGEALDIPRSGLKPMGGASTIPDSVSHPYFPSISGSVFGGVDLKLEALSPIASGLDVSSQQWQFSSSSLSTSSQIRPRLPFPTPPPPSQSSSGPLYQQNFLTKPVLFQGPVLDKQPSSSEQPTPISSLLPSLVPQLPLPKTMEHIPEQLQSHSGPAGTLVLPQIPRPLFDSLKQLQRDLPVPDESLLKANPPVPALSGQAFSQPKLKESTVNMFLTQVPQVPASVKLASIEEPLTKSVTQTSSGTVNNMFAAFLQSAFKQPARGLAHEISETLAYSSVPHLDPLSTVTGPQLPGVPPLPFGPPPPSVGLTNLTAQLVPAVSKSASVSALPVPQPVAPIRARQPPLPPGPPPQQANLISQPQSSSIMPPTSGSDLNSLLSSLLEHGILSAPLSTSTPAQPPALVPNSSSGILGPNPSSHLPWVGTELHGKLPPRSGTVLHTVSEACSKSLEPPLKSVDDASGLEDIEFKQDLLRERRDSVIRALYFDFPRQCKTCGLRFKHQEEHSEHMDWHVTRNRRQKSSKKVSRKWFVNTKEWLSGTGASSSEVSPAFFSEVAEKVEEPESVLSVPADENQVTCALCGEPFEDFYSDEVDEWMYKGAVYLNVPPGTSWEGLDKMSLGPIVHANCRSESDAADALEGADLAGS